MPRIREEKNRNWSKDDKLRIINRHLKDGLSTGFIAKDEDISVKDATYQLIFDIEFSYIDKEVKEYLESRIREINPEYNYLYVIKEDYLKKLEHIRGMFNLYQNGYNNKLKYTVNQKKKKR